MKQTQRRPSSVAVHLTSKLTEPSSQLENDYGKPFAVYGHRYGFLSNLTAGLHFEEQAGQQTAGASVPYKIPFDLIFETSLATGDSSSSTGHNASMGLKKKQHRSRRPPFYAVNEHGLSSD